MERVLCPRVHFKLIIIDSTIAYVGSEKIVDNLTKVLNEDGYQVLSGPRTTGDGYYESCIVGPENILIEITV